MNFRWNLEISRILGESRPDWILYAVSGNSLTHCFLIVRVEYCLEIYWLNTYDWCPNPQAIAVNTDCAHIKLGNKQS